MQSYNVLTGGKPQYRAVTTADCWVALVGWWRNNKRDDRPSVSEIFAMAMRDDSTTVKQLKELVLAFSHERNWEQFHHPKDLGIALVCEVGELFEHFRYRTDAEISARLEDPRAKSEVGDELADCLWLVLRLGDVMGIDLASALEAKVASAGVKYPVDKVYGRPDKYTVYQAEYSAQAQKETP